MLKSIILALVCALPAFAQDFQTPAWEGALKQSTAQLTSIPLPNPLPNFGGLVGANTKWFAPVYNTTITRCTDINSSPETGWPNSYEVTDTGGSDFPIWNANQTFIRVMYANSGGSWVIPFDPVSMTCGTAVPNSHAPAGAVWANRDPNVDFALVGTKVNKRTFDYLHPSVAPVTSEYFDFRSCPGLSTVPIGWHSGLQVLEDDSLIAAAFSEQASQDTGQWVAMYQPATGGCQTWNTLTGQVVGQGFGMTGTISPFYSLTIHNIQMGPGGIIAVSLGTTCVNCPFHNGFLYKAGTLTDIPPVRNASGHGVLGYEKNITANGGLTYSYVEWNNPSVVIPIVHVTGVPWGWPLVSDIHISYRNGDTLDTFPFLVGSTSVTNPQYSGDAPLMRENFMVRYDGTFLRLSPTLSSGVPNTFNFRTANAIGDISKLGCYAWSFDAMGGLGNTDRVHEACTLGAPPPNECRSDVAVICPGK